MRRQEALPSLRGPPRGKAADPVFCKRDRKRDNAYVSQQTTSIMAPRYAVMAGFFLCYRGFPRDPSHGPLYR